jgi:hypothetical protein
MMAEASPDSRQMAISSQADGEYNCALRAEVG